MRACWCAHVRSRVSIAGDPRNASNASLATTIISQTGFRLGIAASDRHCASGRVGVKWSPASPAVFDTRSGLPRTLVCTTQGQWVAGSIVQVRLLSGKPYLSQLVPLVALVREQRFAPASAGDASSPPSTSSIPRPVKARHSPWELLAERVCCHRRVSPGPAARHALTSSIDPQPHD